MFREMRRKKQLLPLEETIALIDNATCAIIGVIGDEGYPYTFPISHALDKEMCIRDSSINSKAPTQGHDKPVLGYSSPYDENQAVVEKGDVVAMATEQVGEGRVFLSGTVFCSNFEVAAEDQVSYSNGIIAQNILKMVQKLSLIHI